MRPPGNFEGGKLLCEVKGLVGGNTSVGTFAGGANMIEKEECGFIWRLFRWCEGCCDWDAPGPQNVIRRVVPGEVCKLQGRRVTILTIYEH